METIEFLAIPWAEYFDGKLTIEDILKMYEDHGFDANQDWPGNVRWEELYDASPKGTKVILTVRDHEEVWYRKALLKILGFNFFSMKLHVPWFNFIFENAFYRSLKNFMIQEVSRDAIFGISGENKIL